MRKVRLKSVKEILEEVPDDKRKLFENLRGKIMVLPGVIEKVDYDEYDDSQSPAYYLGEHEIFHFHITFQKVQGTVPLDSQTLVPQVLALPGLAPMTQEKIRNAKDYRGTRWASVPLRSLDEVNELVRIIQLKYEWVKKTKNPTMPLDAFRKP